MNKTRNTVGAKLLSFSQNWLTALCVRVLFSNSRAVRRYDAVTLLRRQ